MDQSLDDIVMKAKASKRTRRTRPIRNSQLASKRNAAAAAAKKASLPIVTTGPKPQQPQVAEKIMVSGLPTDVNEAQIKELFTTTVGPLKDIQLHFNAQGKWNGTAMVLFSRKGDGTKAYEQYNNRLIDGKKPMRIELIFDPAKAPPPSLVSRVTPASSTAASAKPQSVQRTIRTGRRQRQGKPRDKRPQKSVEDLDAEMEDYTASNAPASAGAPVAAA